LSGTQKNEASLTAGWKADPLQPLTQAH